MDDKQRVKFLKKMGYSGSVLSSVDSKEQRKRADNRVEKSDLLALGRIFGVNASVKKDETLGEFLSKEEENNDNKSDTP